MLPFIVGGAILAVGFGALAFFLMLKTKKKKNAKTRSKRYRELHTQSATG